MGGGSSKPKHIDPINTPVNNYRPNNQNLINTPPEKFMDYNNPIYHYYIIIIILLLLLFYSFILNKRRKNI